MIISEKRDAKAAKYRVKDIPFPYTSRAQYERSLEAPLGREWNTRLGHQKAVLPRVSAKVSYFISYSSTSVGTIWMTNTLASDGYGNRTFGKTVMSRDEHLHILMYRNGFNCRRLCIYYSPSLSCEVIITSVHSVPFNDVVEGHGVFPKTLPLMHRNRAGIFPVPRA